MPKTLDVSSSVDITLRYLKERLEQLEKDKVGQAGFFFCSISQSRNAMKKCRDWSCPLNNLRRDNNYLNENRFKKCLIADTTFSRATHKSRGGRRERRQNSRARKDCEDARTKGRPISRWFVFEYAALFDNGALFHPFLSFTDISPFPSTLEEIISAGNFTPSSLK